jgi:hypothetical protein
MSKCPKGILRISFPIHSFPRMNRWNRRSNSYVTLNEDTRPESAAFTTRAFPFLWSSKLSLKTRSPRRRFLEQAPQCSR